MTTFADCAAAFVVLISTPNEQNPCSSGGLTCTKAASSGRMPRVNSPGTSDRKHGVKSARPSLTARRCSSLMNSVLMRRCPAIAGSAAGAGPNVRMLQISTSRSDGARATSASIRTCGTAQLPVMKTRWPDWMRPTAPSAVVTRWR